MTDLIKYKIKNDCKYFTKYILSSVSLIHILCTGAYIKSLKELLSTEKRAGIDLNQRLLLRTI